MAGMPVAAVVRSPCRGAEPRRSPTASTAGCCALAERFGVELVGGDTNAWDGPLVVSVDAAGRGDRREGRCRRSGARPGDAILVTGPLGGSLLGRHLRPEPRVAEALALHAAAALHAMIDLSDGLASDLPPHPRRERRPRGGPRRRGDPDPPRRRGGRPPRRPVAARPRPERRRGLRALRGRPGRGRRPPGAGPAGAGGRVSRGRGPARSRACGSAGPTAGWSRCGPAGSTTCDETSGRARLDPVSHAVRADRRRPDDRGRLGGGDRPRSAGPWPGWSGRGWSSAWSARSARARRGCPGPGRGAGGRAGAIASPTFVLIHEYEGRCRSTTSTPTASPAPTSSRRWAPPTTGRGRGLPGRVGRPGRRPAPGGRLAVRIEPTGPASRRFDLRFAGETSAAEGVMRLLTAV